MTTFCSTVVQLLFLCLKDFELLVGQNKQFADVNLVFRKL